MPDERLFFLNRKVIAGSGCLFFFCLFALSGCLKSTYPKDYVKESVLKILKNEYNTPLAQVEITGKTIHMYLPVERLFTADLDDVKTAFVFVGGIQFKSAWIVVPARALSFIPDLYWEGLSRLYRLNVLRWFKLNWVQVRFEKKKIEKIQDAIELHPDVQEGIGQMLFAVARVTRSTDLKIDFYSAQVTDVRSGQEFILQGYLDDMNRLQMLDISQSEYHKRMLKDTQVNQRALIHYPVRQFFQDMNQKTRDEVHMKYFSKIASQDWMDRFHFRDKKGTVADVSGMTWEVMDVRSYISPAGTRALVYVRVETLARDTQKASIAPRNEEFLFETVIKGKTVQIARIIPYHLLSELLSSSPDIGLDEQSLARNIQSWRSEFEPKEVLYEDFLARQIMSRAYEIIFQDERIANTFTDLGFDVYFQSSPEREFVASVRMVLKEPDLLPKGKNLWEHEDLIYLEEQLLSMAAKVLHNYRYKEFKSFAIEFPDEGERIIASPEALELYYRKKRALQEVFREDFKVFAAAQS